MIAEKKFILCLIIKIKIFTQVRECKANDKSKQHCFELYATGGAEIIKAFKTDSEGKVRKQKNWNLNFISANQFSYK